MLTGTLQEGVIEAGAYMVTERSAGANMSVDIAADDGSALVQGDSITAQGLYHIPPHSTSINESIATADSTHPRVDQVILEVRDNTHDASGGNEARVRVLTGTPTSGATLDNRTGAAPLPSNAIRLADVLVPANDMAISNSQIRDRRTWARGAECVKVYTTGNVSSTSTSLVLCDSTNLAARIECSGVPLEISMRAQLNAGVGGTAFLPFSDGVGMDGLTDRVGGTDISDVAPLSLQYVWAAPTAGSHVIGWAWRNVSAGTSTLVGGAGSAIQFEVREIVRQQTANNSTTTG